MVAESDEYYFNESVRKLKEWMKSQVRESGIYHGIIKSVDLSNYTCTVIFREEDIDEDTPAGFNNVQLNVLKPCTIDGVEYTKATIVQVPKVGSYCFFGFIANNMFRPILLYCQHYSQVIWELPDPDDNTKITKLTYDTVGIELQKDESVFSVKSGGFKMNNGDNGLKKTLEDLIDAIKAMTFTPASLGSPTPPPNNITDFALIKTNLSNYLE